MIAYEDWQKIEVRIGKIISAERIEKADKLLKLEVDFKDDKKIIVSGIALKYAPEDLIEKEMPFITNLEPREIFGIITHGMILAAHDKDGGPVLMHPDSEIEPGSKIS